jgi:hypothetical protein
MIILKKEPEKEIELTTIENDLKSLQEAVGGYIETVTLAKDLVIICNEEGAIEDLPYNCEVLGVNFYGTILFAGAQGDEFTDLKPKVANEVRKMVEE